MSEFLKNEISKFNCRISEKLDKKYIRYYLSLLNCIILHGASPEDYFRYRFYEKSNLERSKFITYGRSKRIIKKYNNQCINIFNNKIEFNKKFSRYIYRSWLDVQNSSYEEFCIFIDKHKEVFIKVVDSGGGTGIHKYYYNQNDCLKTLYDKCRNMLIESTIRQHSDMNDLNPSSVNSVRVVTFLNKGEVEIIGCTLKIGSANGFIDNLKEGKGVCISIDRDTGITCSYAMNSEFKKFVFHPDTNKKLIGFQIPRWNELITTVKEAAKLVPEVKYLGWDVVILQDGIEIIEANHDPGHNIIQMVDQIGKYEYIKQLVR